MFLLYMGMSTILFNRAEPLEQIWQQARYEI